MDTVVVGGGGFIGSWVVDELVRNGHSVTVVDPAERPSFLPDTVSYLRGRAADSSLMADALDGADAVYLQMGPTGVGRSVEQPQPFHETHVGGALSLMKQVSEADSVQHVVGGSTILVHGVGRYHCPECGTVFPAPRTEEQLSAGDWEQRCDQGHELSPAPLRERDPKQPQTPYARSKLAFEHLLQDLCPSNTSLTLLRYPFVYGPRQHGAAAYFFDSIINGTAPTLFEDGRQQRDFMYVEDVAAANIEAVESELTGVYNIGTGDATPLRTFVDQIADAHGVTADVDIPGEYRPFDVRHTVPDTTRFRTDFDVRPRTLKDGTEKTYTAVTEGEQ